MRKEVLYYRDKYPVGKVRRNKKYETNHYPSKTVVIPARCNIQPGDYVAIVKINKSSAKARMVEREE